MEVIRVQALVSQERQDDLARKTSSIHEISVKQVGIGRGRIAVQFENIEQVVVLAMNISADGHFALIRNCYVDQCWQLRQNLF